MTIAGTGSRTTLAARVAADLRNRLHAKEWELGERLPGELHLAEHYGVSRATIRSALQELEGRGLTVTRRGLGTFVSDHPHGVRADIRYLDSMSDTIRQHGMTPRTVYRNITIRPCTGEEARRLALIEGEDEVLSTSRAVYADDEPVAFSQEAVPMDVLGPDFSSTEVEGSLFGLLDAHGHHVVNAITEIHAVHDVSVGWGNKPESATYLLLRQTHRDITGRSVVFADTHFVEGRFQFGLLRHR